MPAEAGTPAGYLPKIDLMMSTKNSNTIVISRIIIHRVFWSCLSNWYISSSVLSFSSIVRCCQISDCRGEMVQEFDPLLWKLA